MSQHLVDELNEKFMAKAEDRAEAAVRVSLPEQLSLFRSMIQVFGGWIAYVVVRTPAAESTFITATDEMGAYLADLTTARRTASHPPDEFLTRLVTAEVDGERLTAEELLGFSSLATRRRRT